MGIPRFEPLHTERLVIRPTADGDVDALHARRNDPTTAALQSWEVPYPRERAAELVAAMVAHDGIPPSDGWFQLAIDDGESGEPLGDLALHLTFDGRCAEVGYTLAPNARGRGIATEAVDALATWVVDEVGVSRVSAMMHPDNVASIRVAERIGMVFEGRTRNSYWVGDEVSDDVLYGMTPDMLRSWRDRPRSRPDQVGLVEVTSENVGVVRQLELHASQERFVAPMAKWFAALVTPPIELGEALTPWLRAIEADGEIVGALLMSEPTAVHREPYVWRLLVDRMHQRRGIGRRVLDLAVEQAKGWNADELMISWVPAPGTAGPMYEDYGFVPTGELVDGEVEARLALSSSEGPS